MDGYSSDGGRMGKCEFSPGEKPSVLVVDASKAIRRYLEELLAREGYCVATATDGFAGLECIYRNVPDVVLLDVEMPGMSDIDLQELLKTEQQLSSVILFTTKLSLGKRLQVMNIGAGDYITKPFAESELLARVRSSWRTALLKKELACARNHTQVALNRLRDAQRRTVEEQKLVAIAGLAVDVAHQINNPLGIIQGNLHNLLAYARILADGSDRMLRMADLLLDVDKGVQDEVIEILDWMKKVKLASIRQDMEPIITETCGYVEYITSIVNSLRFLDRTNTLVKTDLKDLVVLSQGDIN